MDNRVKKLIKDISIMSIPEDKRIQYGAKTTLGRHKHGSYSRHAATAFDQGYFTAEEYDTIKAILGPDRNHFSKQELSARMAVCNLILKYMRGMLPKPKISFWERIKKWVGA